VVSSLTHLRQPSPLRLLQAGRIFVPPSKRHV